jgi:hypothetical protein
MEIANSIQGRKILYKKNFFDVHAHSGAMDFDKVKDNLQNAAVFSSHFEAQAIYPKKKLEPIKSNNLL